MFKVIYEYNMINQCLWTVNIFANSTNDSSDTDMWAWGVVFEENILKKGWLGRHWITKIWNPSEK